MLYYRTFGSLLVCFFCWEVAFAQVTVSGGYWVIPVGSTVVATDLRVQNKSGATIANHGMLATTDHITNAAGAVLTGNGLWKLGGNWTNAGTFAAGTSTVLFDGSGGSTVAAGGAPFHRLHLGKNNNNLMLASAVTVLDEVVFLTNNNKIVCGSFDCTVAETAAISGADSNDFFVTDGTG